MVAGNRNRLRRKHVHVQIHHRQAQPVDQPVRRRQREARSGLAPPKRESRTAPRCQTSRFPAPQFVGRISTPPAPAPVSASGRGNTTCVNTAGSASSSRLWPFERLPADFGRAQRHFVFHPDGLRDGIRHRRRRDGVRFAEAGSAPAPRRGRNSSNKCRPPARRASPARPRSHGAAAPPPVCAAGAKAAASAGSTTWHARNAGRIQTNAAAPFGNLSAAHASKRPAANVSRQFLSPARPPSIRPTKAPAPPAPASPGPAPPRRSVLSATFDTAICKALPGRCTGARKRQARRRGNPRARRPVAPDAPRHTTTSANATTPNINTQICKVPYFQAPARTAQRSGQRQRQQTQHRRAAVPARVPVLPLEQARQLREARHVRRAARRRGASRVSIYQSAGPGPARSSIPPA